LEKGVIKDAPLGERQSMVYLGTTIGSGSGVAVVVATGAETELGKIATWGN
jgi:Ca2+-transporting ATPase